MAMKQRFSYLANVAAPVEPYSSFTVVAAAASTVQVSFDDGATFIAYGTATIPAAGYLTITDLCTHVKINAVFKVIGLLSTASS